MTDGQPTHAPALGVSLCEGRTGDLGWILQRHAVIYARHGYAPIFEGYVAEGIARFVHGFDARRDRVWIATVDDVPVGSIAIQHDPDRTGWAKLRWFLVEEEARGQGVGLLLLEKALDFSREAGYHGVYLWTVDDLHDARRLYERVGFTLAAETDDCAWAPGQHEQRWELVLGDVA